METNTPDDGGTDSELDLAEAQRHLDAFLVDNEGLESLTAALNRFNIFRVLRIEHAEIRHSNVLAWLLTPNGTHGLGSLFLRRFVSTFLLEGSKEVTWLTPAAVELMRFDDVEVSREWANIDILVVSRANRWCLVIENKVWSSESRGQLERYRNAVSLEYPGFEQVCVLLTLEGDEPSTEGRVAGFQPLGYERVVKLAE